METRFSHLFMCGDSCPQGNAGLRAEKDMHSKLGNPATPTLQLQRSVCSGGRLRGQERRQVITMGVSPREGPSYLLQPCGILSAAANCLPRERTLVLRGVRNC